MPIDFSKLLSPEARARLALEDREIRRQYTLPNRFLAEELLKMAREVRDSRPGMAPQADSAESRYFWHVIPEIARRLGATHFRSNERHSQEVVQKTDDELRLYAGYLLKDMPNFIPVYEFQTTLLHEPVHGNPVCLALDRLAPPKDVEVDPIAKSIAGPARSRGVEFSGQWTPSLLDYANKSVIRPDPEAELASAKAAAKVLSFESARVGKGKSKGSGPGG